MQPILKYPFFLALDKKDPEEAWKFLQAHHDNIGGVKLGPKLILQAGWDFIKKASEIAPVFLDFKFHDIPSVTLAAVKESFRLGASFVTVHASVGKEALSLLYNFQEEANKSRPFKILVVSILTSFSEEQQLPHWKEGAIKDKVKALASLVKQSGLNGFVCSPQEVKYLKPLNPDFFFVTPGIRLTSNHNALAEDDQSRTLTPLEALSAGSNAMVIGRPIYNSENPENILQSIILDCKSVL
ncbi:MAG: orotidine-5'-phosphate decarboxylase [Bdellovibrionaceae bacterium]|nr:orotidine-5'-phosphate decarboxylase [Pseudobdellovibrionaceae bacterium]